MKLLVTRKFLLELDLEILSTRMSKLKLLGKRIKLFRLTKGSSKLTRKPMMLSTMSPWLETSF